MALVIGGGTFGYNQLGLSVGDAVYQTVITITTVGYQEIGTVTGAYRAFTVVLILFGTGTALYTLGVLIESLFEGRLDDQIRRRRMQKQIDRLAGHVVLCGFGQVGRAIYDEMIRAGRRVVVIDQSDLHPEVVPLNVVGDATSDDVLVAAGMERAETLVIALDNDVDNLYIALTARSMCPGLFIVARSNRNSGGPKLRQAGVDRVVNPHEIGGSRMAALVLQPDVVEFLDVVMHDEQLEVRLAELQVTAECAFAGAGAGGVRHSRVHRLDRARRAARRAIRHQPARQLRARPRRRVDRSRHRAPARPAPGQRPRLGARAGSLAAPPPHCSIVVPLLLDARHGPAATASPVVVQVPANCRRPDRPPVGQLCDGVVAPGSVRGVLPAVDILQWASCATGWSRHSGAGLWSPRRDPVTCTPLSGMV